jgi:hypothetical protein
VPASLNPGFFFTNNRIVETNDEVRLDDGKQSRQRPGKARFDGRGSIAGSCRTADCRRQPKWLL